MVAKLSETEILEVVKQLVKTAKDLHGDLLGDHKLMLLLTAGSGDFSLILNVYIPSP